MSELRKMIDWCRANFWADGAEGESVHRLCDLAEAAEARVAELEAAFTRTTRNDAEWETIDCVVAVVPRDDALDWVRNMPRGDWYTVDAITDALMDALEGTDE